VTARNPGSGRSFQFLFEVPIVGAVRGRSSTRSCIHCLYCTTNGALHWQDWRIQGTLIGIESQPNGKPDKPIGRCTFRNCRDDLIFQCQFSPTFAGWGNAGVRCNGFWYLTISLKYHAMGPHAKTRHVAGGGGCACLQLAVSPICLLFSKNAGTSKPLPALTSESSESEDRRFK